MERYLRYKSYVSFEMATAFKDKLSQYHPQTLPSIIKWPNQSNNYNLLPIRNQMLAKLQATMRLHQVEFTHQLVSRFET
jgi:hypothetical protein